MTRLVVGEIRLNVRDELRPRHHSTQARIRDPHPLGFKTLIHRVEKFSGREGDNDFEIWLMDFKEATEHCGWNDEQRTKWFSWFLSGPAKATWQRTLKDTDKTSWQKIVATYRGQYGVHLDPRIAYQKCQELQYSQFGSAQGLLYAMRDYQRMAPEKLSDATMESILWNKVPIALQQELKEIQDGSVQELLQRLLRAEATLKERERRSKGIRLGLSQRHTFNSNRSPNSGPGRGNNNNNAAEKSGNNTSSSNTNSHDQQQREMSLKNVKCYNCHKKGHLAKDCPITRGQRTSSTRRIGTVSGDTTEQQDLWLRTVTAKTEQQLKETTVAARGPTYKVDIVVDGVRTQALLDHGAQVSLARKQLLPVIKERNEWSVEQCQARNLTLAGQPQGAGGHDLGAEGIVALQLTAEGTGISQRVPCYILDSSKPIWKGELKDCGLVIGTNALANLGFSIVDAEGCIVTSEESASQKQGIVETSIEATEPQDNNATMQKTVENGDTASSPTNGVYLARAAYLTPGQSKVVHVNVTSCKDDIGVVTPIGDLANALCDFQETLWSGSTQFKITLNNWGMEPVILPEGQQVGSVELADIVSEDDPVWEDPEAQVLLCQATNEAERREELKKQLRFGSDIVSQERDQMETMLLTQSDVFALTDEELGETDLVSHSIDTGMQSLSRHYHADYHMH